MITLQSDKLCKHADHSAEKDQTRQATNVILNQKRNFCKIGLRGGHTRYERKKKIDTYLK